MSSTDVTELQNTILLCDARGCIDWLERNKDTIDLNARAPDGMPPIIDAILHQDASVIEWMLEHGAKADVTDANGGTALYYAASFARHPTVELLLGNGAEANQANRDDTPRPSVIDQLLGGGADANRVNRDDGETALHAAASSAKVWICASLLAAKADPNAFTVAGDTPLHAAAMAGGEELMETRRQTLQSLYKDKREAEKVFRNSFGPPIGLDPEGRPAAEVVHLLVEKGARVNTPNEDGDTPLAIAVRYGNATGAEALMAHGAEVDCCSGANWTLWHEVASASGEIKPDTLTRICRILADAGAPLNKQFITTGAAPLHVAIACGNDVVIRHLMDAGAHAWLQGPGGLTAVEMAGQTRRAVNPKTYQRICQNLVPLNSDESSPTAN